MKRVKYTAMLLATMLAASAQAQQVYWLPESGDFSTPANWNTGLVPSDAQAPTFDASANQFMNVDGNYTIERIYKDWNAGGFLSVIDGPGTLTVQGNAGQNFLGIANRSGASGGGGLQLAGNVVINRPWGNNFTEIRNDNGANNYIEFTETSQLTLQTPVLALDFTGGQAAIRFNGTLLGNSELHVQSPTVSFNAGHDSSGHTGDILLNGNGAKLTINGGTVSASGNQLIGNYGANTIVLNAANAINGAGISAWGALTLDVNAGQNNMGSINEVQANGLTLDILGIGAGELWFANSSGGTWTGAVSLLGFQEDVVRFGTDSTGLTLGQLGAINGGIYNLTEFGYLTAIPEPTAMALLLLGGMGLVAARRKKV